MEEFGTKLHIPFGFKHFSLFSPKPSVCEQVCLYLCSSVLVGKLVNIV